MLLELETIKNSSDINTTESDFKLSNNKILKKYKLESGFYYGMNNSAPGSGYMDFYEDKIFIVSSRGTLAFRNDFNLEYENFQQIKNNINYFIGFDKLFYHKECNYKSAYRAGGRIVQLDDNHIILSNGDYGLEYLAQDKKASMAN